MTPDVTDAGRFFDGTRSCGGQLYDSEVQDYDIMPRLALIKVLIFHFCA